MYENEQALAINRVKIINIFSDKIKKFYYLMFYEF